MVTVNVASDPALTFEGLNVTAPASYLDPTCSSHEPWTEATVRVAVTVLIVTEPDVPLFASVEA